jgi:hypothetical protein
MTFKSEEKQELQYFALQSTFEVYGIFLLTSVNILFLTLICLMREKICMGLAMFAVRV